MRARRLLLVLGCVAAVVGAVAVLRTRGRPGPEAQAPDTKEKAPPLAARGGTPRASAAAAARFAQVLAALAQAKIPTAGQPARVKRDEILARVNGIPIVGRQLLPFRDGSVDEESVSAEMYTFLLERAINREVTFQEARRLGVELSTEQRGQLQKRFEEEGDLARAAFDKHDAEYQLLLTALAARAGVPSPFATQADVEAYHREHAAEFEALPEEGPKRAAAWNAIQLSIRRTLAEDRQIAHGVGLKELLANLKTSATISPN